VNIEREIKENHPIYPLSVQIPRKLSVRIGSRKFHVDLPYIVYLFMLEQVEKAASGVVVTKESIKSEWRRLEQNYKDLLTINGEPIATVYLTYQPFASSNFLILKIHWSRLIEYLELKAEETMKSVVREGEKTMKGFYGYLWLNFFMISRKAVQPAEVFAAWEMRKIKRLLEIIGDQQEINNAVNKLVNAVDSLNRLRKYVRHIELCIVTLKFHARNILKAIDYVNTQLVYLLLRTILEHLVKFAVYLDSGMRLRDPDLILFFTFFNEYRAKERKYGIKAFIDELEDKFRSALKRYSSINQEELINKLAEMHIPHLMVNSNTLREFAETYGLSDIREELGNIYSACSWVIHNRPILPYYSLLELKLLKHFIIRYAELTTKIIDMVTSNALCKLA